MYLELKHKEREQLIELVRARLNEIDAEIRRSTISTYHDELKEPQAALQRILNRLHESSYDVTC